MHAADARGAVHGSMRAKTNICLLVTARKTTDGCLGVGFSSEAEQPAQAGVLGKVKSATGARPQADALKWPLGASAHRSTLSLRKIPQRCHRDGGGTQLVSSRAARRSSVLGGSNFS